MVLPRAERRRIRLLDGTAETWPAMLAAIDGARDSIELEIYAFLDGVIGRCFLAALAAAASRGVRVRVTLDAWGSIGSARRISEQLKNSGCEARVHNPLLNGFVGRWNRNHRKLLLVDGRLAILGGINIGDSFTDWADLAVELRGEVCEALARRLHGEHFVEQNGRVRVHLSRIGGGRRLRKMYLKAFGAAQHRIAIAHSYFLPDRRMLRALVRAARRGLEVLLIVPGKSDVPLVRLVTATQYRRLLRAGVRVVEWDRGILHAKLAVVDGKRLLIGSFNLDPFSLANLETLVVADDHALAARAEAWIEKHAAQAKPAVEPRHFGWLGWLLQLLARFFGHLMRS